MNCSSLKSTSPIWNVADGACRLLWFLGQLLLLDEDALEAETGTEEVDVDGVTDVRTVFTELLRCGSRVLEDAVLPDGVVALGLRSDNIVRVAAGLAVHPPRTAA